MSVSSVICIVLLSILAVYAFLGAFLMILMKARGISDQRNQDTMDLKAYEAELQANSF